MGALLFGLGALLLALIAWLVSDLINHWTQEFIYKHRKGCLILVSILVVVLVVLIFLEKGL